jgi:serine kinase
MFMRDSVTAREFLRMADVLIDRGYRLGSKIGEGTYAKVRICERNKDGTILAVKIVNLKKASKDYINKFMPRELNIIQRINHRNIINTHDVIRSNNLMYIVIDYAERGDLLQHIRDNGPIPDKEAKNMFRQILSAVKYLHETNIAHRDLKCENILIMRDKSVVVSDFGFARPLETADLFEGKFMSVTFCGSPSYAPPEVLSGIPYDPKMSDVWSLGVLLYIMVSGTMPYDDSNVRKMVNNQLYNKMTFPEHLDSKINPDCKSLIRQMLEPSLDKRLTIENILQSKWVSSHCES